MTEAPLLGAALPYRFRDESLLGLALTHSSTGAERDNERLEFLGDAVLDLLVAEQLFHDRPDLSEGMMTELKARVVSRRALASAAALMGIEGALSVGPGLHQRALPRSVLANLYEALLGAVYLDGGLDAARSFVRQTLRENLASAHEERYGGNPKQELQHICQRRWGAPPEYRVIEQRGESHARAFLVVARAGGRSFPSAWGRTMKEAERWSAYEALLVLAREEAG